MNWNELKAHCERAKNGKTLNTHRPLQKKNYVPVWQRMKDYTPSVANMEMLAKNCGNPEQAENVAIQELKAGIKLKVMG